MQKGEQKALSVTVVAVAEVSLAHIGIEAHRLRANIAASRADWLNYLTATSCFRDSRCIGLALIGADALHVSPNDRLVLFLCQ